MDNLDHRNSGRAAGLFLAAALCIWGLGSFGAVPFPLTSLRQIRADLANCDAVLSDPVVQLSATYRAQAQRCERLADAAIRGSPRLSVAHLARARAQWAQGMDPGVALDQARGAAPRVAWLAARRLALAADADQLDLAEADLRLLVQTPQGRGMLRQVVVSRPAMRSWVVDHLEGGPL